MAVADVAQEHGAEVTSLGAIGTRQGDSDQRLRKRPAQAIHRVCVSEAGPWGDWRSRDLTPKGHGCWVGAPSLLPNTAGARVNTDRRDASPVARRRRSGDVPPVSVPRVADAAIRARTRARADPIRALNAAQFRLQAFWRRQEIRSTGRAPWSPAPRRGRSAGVCPTPAQPMVFQADVRAVPEPTARRQRLDQELHAQVTAWRLPPVVAALPALRGVPCPVAVTPLAALGDLTRVDPPRPLMQCLGLMPAAYSRGERRRQGALTTPGNTPARRALVAGAGAYQEPAHGSRPLQRRRDTPPQAIQDIRWKAHGRWCHRARTLRARGTHATQVVVAMARDLVGLMGAMAQPVAVTPATHKTR
jgi:transposase